MLSLISIGLQPTVPLKYLKIKKKDETEFI